ncbi:unnamed protein product [Closterium sp. NIES-64]|nr:unnamed protein product [Closterium sp. NIES-64]
MAPPITKKRRAPPQRRAPALAASPWPRAAVVAAVVVVIAMAGVTGVVGGPFLQESQVQFLRDCQDAWGNPSMTWSDYSDWDCRMLEFVYCDRSGMIVALDIVNMNVEGPIPESISSLHKLEFLFVFHSPAASFNSLHSFVPTPVRSAVTLLIVLPARLAQLVWDLSYNSLTGPIPESLGDIAPLTWLPSPRYPMNDPITPISTRDLSHNMLSGSIPPSLGSLGNLGVMTLSFNQLSGDIPAELGSLLTLSYLQLSQNELSGSIPESLFALANLNTLALSMNQLTGTISALSKLVNLVSLSLASNHLYGSIPASVANLAGVVTFDLSHNHFTGPMVKPDGVTADLSSNYLSGTLTEPPSDVSLGANCFTASPAGATWLAEQRPEAACRAFCGISIRSAAAACGGNGMCYPDGPSLAPTCLCDAGFVQFASIYCLAEGSVLTSPVDREILPPATVLTKGTMKETKGAFTEDPVTLFVFEKGREDEGCGFELGFNVNFTFALSPKGKAASNGFAFVVSATNSVGTNVGVGYGGVDPRSMAIEFDVLQTKPHGDMKEQHVGLNINGQDKSIAVVKSPFPLANKQAYTAWVDYQPGLSGTIQVFLAKGAVTSAGKRAGKTTVEPEKPAKPLLERRLSLCEVLRPEKGEEEQLQAFYFGFVASTTVKPFMSQVIHKSAMHAAFGLSVTVDTYAPARASPFPRYVSAECELANNNQVAWSFKDLYSWDSVPFLGWPVKNQAACNACWAYAVVASIEAAYGLAMNAEAPQLSVESLFAAMGLTTQPDKCPGGGSPTEAFEKLLSLPKGGVSLVDNPGKKYPIQGFERTSFKGYVGLMLAVQRQPVVVHIEASAATFTKYDGTFKYQDPACYSGNLNHVVLVVGYFILRDDGSQSRIAPPFWIIRNSWGEGWGDRGHMRIDIQGGDGVCGINVLPGIYPIVKIPGDPCGTKSYKGDGDLQPSMNPCGRFTCTPNTKTNGNTCDCRLPSLDKQPFVEVANGYGNTCAYVDVCGSYFKNPCAVGTCINDGKGSYSCICPPNHVPSRTIDDFPTCDPASATVTSLTVSGDKWTCADVSGLVGLSEAQFTQQNPDIVCSQALPKEAVLKIAGTPAIPCTGFFYTLNGDKCNSIASSMGITKDDLMALNPGLSCTQAIKPGRSLCVERNASYAYTVPKCVKYATLTAQDTCGKLLEGAGNQKVEPFSWAELYRNNPGLVCSGAIPSGASAVGSNTGVQVCLRAEYWSFELGRCTNGRQKPVKPSLPCSGAYRFYRNTGMKVDDAFDYYNGGRCAGTVGGDHICVK